MFRIITKRVGTRHEALEVHVYSRTQMHDHISRVMADAVRANRGFVYMEDVGASAPAIKFNDGETVNVQHS